MQWITVAKVQWNFFVFKTSLAGIMIQYLLVMAQRPSSAGDGTETLSFRLVMAQRPSSAGDGTETLSFRLVMAQRPSPLGTNVETSGSGECDDCCPCILQMISISVTVHLFCML